jgi:hypothetical protein
MNARTITLHSRARRCARRRYELGAQEASASHEKKENGLMLNGDIAVDMSRPQP